MTDRTYSVLGLTCEHCVRAVRDEVSALPGVSEVDIELVPGAASTVRVASTEPLSDTQLATALDEAGDYRLA